LWDDANLLEYLRQALDILLKETGLYKRKVTSIQVSAGTYEVSVDSDEFGVVEVWVDGKRLSDRISYERIRQAIDWGTTGVPQYYAFRDGTIFLYPIPSSTVTLDYEAKVTILDINDVNAEPPIKEHYHLYLIDGILGFAYGKADAETFDAKSADMFMGRFLSYVSKIKGELIRDEHAPDINTIPKGFL
jgi:hypothetical protein